MQDERSGRFPAVGWALAVLSLPVLYVLSVPPVWEATVTPALEVPPWVRAYVQPYKWIQRETPLEPYLTAYAELWYELCGSRR